MRKIPKICVIEGDGVGKEVVPETVRVLKEIGDFEFINAGAGLECLKKYGDAIPEETIQTAKECDAVLFGAITTPKPTELKDKTYRSPILTLRKELDLYANVRPIYNFYENQRFSNPVGGAKHFCSDNNIDFVIVRENTEGLYSKREYYNEEGEFAVAERIISKKGSERIIKFAFDYAVKNNRKKVSCIHKSNVLRITDGLFLEIFNNIGLEYNKKFNMEFNDYLVDATAMYIIKNPQMFDVMVTTNLFGDILSDEASALIGGLGMAPSANIGDKSGLFEPVHGSAPDIAGKGIANPIGTILSAAMMLDYLDMKKKGDLLRAAVKSLLEKGFVTPDLGGSLKTSEVTDKIIEYIHKI
jgi:methanogen homoisocitrate dehydrogenase